MKRTYITPETRIEQAEAASMLAASITGTIDGGDSGIGYGGTDDDGTLDPGAKENTDTYDWDF